MATKKELRDAALAEYLKVRDAAEAEYEKVRDAAEAEYHKRLAEINAMPDEDEDPAVTAAIKLLEGCGYKVLVD